MWSCHRLIISGVRIVDDRAVAAGHSVDPGRWQQGGGDGVRADAALGDQPVGEEGLQQGAPGPSRCPHPGLGPAVGRLRVVVGFQPLGGQCEQLRAGLQVPVGRLRAGMAEEGGQHRQAGLHVDAVGVSAGEHVDRERVPKISSLRRPG